MMFLAKKLISAWVLSPASLGLLCLLGTWLLYRGSKRVGLLLAGIGGVSVLVLSLPVVSHALLQQVEMAPVSVGQLRKADAIVILGGGIHRGAAEFEQPDTLSTATLVRVRYGAWLAKRTGLPVLVSGGSVFGKTAEATLMADALRNEFGVQVKWVEGQSKDTAGNAAMAAAMLKREGVSNVAVVTHASHARRASCLFQRAGLTAIMAPTSQTTESTDFEEWLPSGRSLQESFIALHEVVGGLMCK